MNEHSVATNTTHRMNNQEQFESYLHDALETQRQESLPGMVTGFNSVGFQTKREDSNEPIIQRQEETTYHNANTVCQKSTTYRENSSMAATSIAMVSNNRIGEIRHLNHSFSQMK